MSEIIFAYGSNMCSARFRDYGVVPEAPGQAALLHGYRLEFNKKSIDGSGKANVEPHIGEQVWGVMYLIPDEHLRDLDSGEGSGYRRERLQVQKIDGTITEAWTYLARKPDADSGLCPYSWYKQFLISGAREHALPLQYVEKLELIRADQDPNQKRDREKRALSAPP